MENNGMAYIGKVIGVSPIEGADRIESIVVVCGSGGKWSAVSQKGQLAVDDLCEVYLQDALLPEDDSRFSFMERHKFRVKMMRLRGAPSEALVMPLSDPCKSLDVGSDITRVIGVGKYDKPLPFGISGEIVGNFPSFVPKTDEPNFQKVPHLVDALRGKQFYATVKADGTSSTAYHKDGVFGVCSRRYELKELDHNGSLRNAIWHVANKYNLRDKLPALGNMAIQWETVGPGIQSNPMGLPELDMRVFDFYNIDAMEYLHGWEVANLCDRLGLRMAEVVELPLRNFNMTDDELRAYAEGVYQNGKQREGVVVRPMFETRVNGERISFKVINLRYGE